MEKFVSLEKLLFTHKPLARRITALQRNLIKILSEGVGKIQKPLVFLHFSAFLIYSHSLRLNTFCIIYVCPIPSDGSDSLWHSYSTACTASGYHSVIRVITGKTALL